MANPDRSRADDKPGSDSGVGGAPSGLAGELRKRDPFSVIEQETYLNLARTYAVLSGEFAKLFKRFGLTIPQYNALRILRGEGRPMQIYQIAERMVTPQTDISRLVVRLSNADLIERAQDDADRRITLVSLSDHGRTVLADLDEPLVSLHRRQFRYLDRAEVEQLNFLLHKTRRG